jgi:hypothetical protein
MIPSHNHARIYSRNVKNGIYERNNFISWILNHGIINMAHYNF